MKSIWLISLLSFLAFEHRYVEEQSTAQPRDPIEILQCLFPENVVAHEPYVDPTGHLIIHYEESFHDSNLSCRLSLNPHQIDDVKISLGLDKQLYLTVVCENQCAQTKCGKHSRSKPDDSVTIPIANSSCSELKRNRREVESILVGLRP